MFTHACVYACELCVCECRFVYVLFECICVSVFMCRCVGWGLGHLRLDDSEKRYLRKAPAIQINPPNKREII